MQADLPHTLYLRDRKKGGGKGSGGSFKYNPEDPAIAMQAAANRRMKERREKEGGKVEYTMDELFNR